MIKNILAIAVLLMASQAQAATAYLVSCNTGTSVTGRFVYIGTYEYNGQRFQRASFSWCPQSIQVF